MSEPIQPTRVHVAIGVLCGVTGGPATYGSPPEVEFSFSDRYCRGVFTPDSAQPPELAERGVLFQVGADEIDPGLAQQFGEEVPHSILRAIGRTELISVLFWFSFGTP